VYRHHLMANHGCGAPGNRGPCRATFGIRAVPVDADTGKLLGGWQWAGFAARTELPICARRRPIRLPA
jgi:hypothetical protein